MPKTTEKTIKQPIITVRILPGPISPAMRRAWVTFWKRLIASATSEVKADERYDPQP